MKFLLTKAEFDALSDDMKKEYKLEGDTAKLTLEGGPDFDGISSKLEIEKEHRKNAEKRLRETEARETKLKTDLENAGGNKDEIKRLNDEHQKEIEKLRNEREAETKAIKEERNRNLIQKTAVEFANEKFIDTPFGAKFIAEKYASRLSVEEVDGQPVVRVKNADGTPSTASLSDLQKEFLDNKDFSPIIKQKVGSGGGALGNLGGGATGKKISEMSPKEMAAYEKENPEEFAAAMEAENG